MDTGNVDEVSFMKAFATLRDGLLDFVMNREVAGVSVTDDEIRREGCRISRNLIHMKVFRS